MTLATVVLKNLIRRPARSLLTAAGISIGIAAVVSLVGLSWGFENSWRRLYAVRGTDLVVIKAGSLSPVPALFNQDDVKVLQGFPGVAQTSVMLSDLTGIEDAPVVLLSGWERNTFIWDHLRVVSGRWPSTDA